MKPQTYMLPLVSLVLTSCVTSPPSPSQAGELVGLVLFLEEQPDGAFTHSWKQAEEVDLSHYSPRLSRHAQAPGRIVPAVAGTRDCDAENRECMRECMSRPLARGFGHVTSGRRGLGGKESYCNEKCMQPYRDCMKAQELQPREFKAVDSALNWLKDHRQSVLVGSIVVIAGVTFVVVSAGAGALILAPAVLLAGPGAPTEPLMVEVAP